MIFYYCYICFQINFFVYILALSNQQNFHLQCLFMLYIIFEKLHLYVSINRLNTRNNQFLGNLYCAISVLLDFHKKKNNNCIVQKCYSISNFSIKISIYRVGFSLT